MVEELQKYSTVLIKMDEEGGRGREVDGQIDCFEQERA